MYVSASFSFLFAYRIFFFCSFSLRIIKFLFCFLFPLFNLRSFFVLLRLLWQEGEKNLSSSFPSVHFFHCSCECAAKYATLSAYLFLLVLFVVVLLSLALFTFVFLSYKFETNFICFCFFCSVSVTYMPTNCCCCCCWSSWTEHVRQLLRRRRRGCCAHKKKPHRLCSSAALFSRSLRLLRQAELERECVCVEREKVITPTHVHTRAKRNGERER